MASEKRRIVLRGGESDGAEHYVAADEIRAVEPGIEPGTYKIVTYLPTAGDEPYWDMYPYAKKADIPLAERR